jgi:transcription-repair coupling factor (superfamily II helicase)
VLHGDLSTAIVHFWRDAEARYRLLRGDRARPLLPNAMFVPEDSSIAC